MWFKYALKAQKLIAQGNGRKQHALIGVVSLLLNSLIKITP